MKGLGVSPGIVMGQVYVDWKEQLEIEKDYVDDAEGEVERLNLAVATASEEIRQLYAGETVVVDKDEAGPICIAYMALCSEIRNFSARFGI